MTKAMWGLFGASTFHLLVATCNAAVPAALQLPGAPPFDEALQTKLRHAWSAFGTTSKPRTSHLNADGSPQYINRLVFSSSPYLQQHAFNPVNWYAWGDEAFAAAKRENKPVFLSIGYSTCHWCHVMERECFENEVIARQLNERFIAIKVDREERPDIDAVYISAVQRMTGAAGWPLSVFLTPDRTPFYGGTYFPPEDLGNRPGFPKLLKTLADTWTTGPESVVQASAALTESLQRPSAPGTATNLTEDTLRKGAEQLAQLFDATNGGFGHAPKFPQAHMLQFLLRYWQRSGTDAARGMAVQTLQSMGRGGIHDFIGGGFHRYSMDAEWRVPHFEKMLYDQAIDARAYLEAYQASQSEFGGAARDIFAYVLRDLAAPNGGFYAAEDADSDGQEGGFYLWTRAQVLAAIGPTNGPLVADLFGLGDTSAPAVLRLPVPVDKFIQQRGIKPLAFAKTIAVARAALFAVRTQRPRPLRDEKIITAWNGLMIASLAYGSSVLGDAQYASAAGRAADFILTHLQRNGRLLRSFRNEPSAMPGYLDDYACFILGLSELYSATLDVRWLREADRLSRDMIRLFGDTTTGGLRYSAADHEQLIAPSDSFDDTALPSAQSVAAYVLVRLGRLTMNKEFDGRARAVLAAHSEDIDQSPTAHTFMLMALDFALGPTQEIVIAGAPDADGTKALLGVVRRQYLPRSVLALHAPGDREVEMLVPFIKEQKMIGDAPTAYVCENYVCKLPTTDRKQLEELLSPPKPTPAAK